MTTAIDGEARGAPATPAGAAQPIRSVLICGYGLIGRGVGNTFAGSGLNVTDSKVPARK